MHLFERGAFGIAEAEWRRAVWLNPFEAIFKANLAWCLFKQHKVAEAQQWAKEVVEHDPDNEDMNGRLAPILRSSLPAEHAEDNSAAQL
jgi:Tfp pilus assembly protein PilF